jgi:hypothetical protein
MDLEEVISALHLTPDRADIAVRRFEKSGLSQCAVDGEFGIISTGWLDSLEIVAIEIKLSRWREALWQAREYFQFADRSYVAIDAGRVEVTSTILDEFIATGVGLIAFGKQGATLVCEASPSVPSGANWIQAIQKLCIKQRSGKPS